MTNENESHYSENISSILAQAVIEALEGDDAFGYVVKRFVH